MTKKSLGIDIGSSSVKVSLLDIASGECVASSTNPSQEMPIEALQSGWAEQDPDMWWKYVVEGIKKISEQYSMSDVYAYLQFLLDNPQLHGCIRDLATTYTVEEINTAFADMRAQKNIKTLLVK